MYEIVFRENFERAYIEATEQFYNVKAPQQLALEADGEKAGVFGYMKWAEAKLREEEQRALKYLETSTGNPFIWFVLFLLYFMKVPIHLEKVNLKWGSREANKSDYPLLNQEDHLPP